MPRWFASTPRRRASSGRPWGSSFGGMALVETAIDTFYRSGMVTALPGRRRSGCCWPSARGGPASAAVLGSLTVLGNYALGHARPGRRPADRHGHPGRPRRGGPARAARGADVAAVATLAVLVSGFAFIPSPWEGFFYLLVTGAAWGVGALVRQMQERSRRAAGARRPAGRPAGGGGAASAVVAERARIAREVHDSVAHSVSVMVLQMGGLRRLLPDEPEAQEVLLGLERLGREAVDEMRRVVGILREGGGEAVPTRAPALAVPARRRPRRAARRRDADRAAR